MDTVEVVVAATEGMAEAKGVAEEVTSKVVEV